MTSMRIDHNSHLMSDRELIERSGEAIDGVLSVLCALKPIPGGLIRHIDAASSRINGFNGPFENRWTRR